MLIRVASRVSMVEVNLLCPLVEKTDVEVLTMCLRLCPPVLTTTTLWQVCSDVHSTAASPRVASLAPLPQLPTLQAWTILRLGVRLGRLACSMTWTKWPLSALWVRCIILSFVRLALTMMLSSTSVRLGPVVSTVWVLDVERVDRTVSVWLLKWKLWSMSCAIVRILGLLLMISIPYGLILIFDVMVNLTF